MRDVSSFYMRMVNLMKNNGYLFIRWGIGLLFLWGGLGKLIPGFLGGPGIAEFTNMLQGIGFGFLGEVAVVLAVVVAVVELLAGLMIIVNKKFVHLSYVLLAIILFVALVLVHIGSGAWMNIMIHVAIFLALAGFAIATNPKNK